MEYFFIFGMRRSGVVIPWNNGLALSHDYWTTRGGRALWTWRKLSTGSLMGFCGGFWVPKPNATGYPVSL